MDIRKLDLNLLVVFDAVMSNRNVTKAAAKLGMTQPSISHALARLRTALKDDLFVRTPEGMTPTPYAVHLAVPIHRALLGIAAAVQGGHTFDPATASRSFVAAVNNQTAVALVPILVEATMEAPAISIDWRPSGTLDLHERLDLGEIDIAIGGLIASGERFEDRRLFDDGFVVMARAQHPAMLGGALTFDELAGYPHLDLSSTGENVTFVDLELDKKGLKRHVALRAPLLAAATLLLRSDMLAVVSERTARCVAREPTLKIQALPFAAPRLTTAMVWHRRWNDDPAHSWLRQLIFRVSRSTIEFARG